MVDTSKELKRLYDRAVDAFCKVRDALPETKLLKAAHSALAAARRKYDAAVEKLPEWKELLKFKPERRLKDDVYHNAEHSVDQAMAMDQTQGEQEEKATCHH